MSPDMFDGAYKSAAAAFVVALVVVLGLGVGVGYLIRGCDGHPAIVWKKSK